MKKICILCLLTAMLLVSTICACTAQEEITLAVGDEFSGFVVQSISDIGPLGAVGVRFEHIKSGAQLLYIDTNDTNRAFDISFRTPALDEKGKPHVFEHMTICGSQKYPDANMFFPFCNQTYNTFVNAMTYHGMTSYPVASLSEEQLMTMMDYYLSGVFSPLVVTEPLMAQREAWRYELSSVDAPINVAGTVYSEMQGAMNIATQANTNDLYTLFEGGAVSHVSGGRPEDILTLTYDELIAFHDAYYHPSNALIVLYGDLDYAAFMEKIDADYLSAYDKKDIAVERGIVEPYAQTKYAVYDMPVEAGAQTQDASYIYYSFGMADASLEDTLNMAALIELLNQESSMLTQTLHEVLPSANVSISLNLDCPQPEVSFVASGVNESDRDLFVSTVDACLDTLAESGIAKEELEAILAASKLSLLLSPENTSLGVNSAVTIALLWTYFDRTDYYEAYERMLNEVDTQTLNDTMTHFLLDNTYRAVSVTRPVAGLAEEKAAALREQLAQVKASMTQEELEDMVAQTAEFAAWSSAAPDSELMDELLVVTADTLPEDIVHYDVQDETKDGVRYLSSEAAVSGVTQVQLELDASTLPIDKLQDAALYMSLLGQLDTEKYPVEKLTVLINQYLYGFSGSISAKHNFAPDGEPLYLSDMSFIALNEQIPQSVELLAEIMQGTQLTDTTRIRDIMTRTRVSFEQSLEALSLNIQIARAQAALSTEAAFNAYLDQFAYYTYLDEMLALDDEKLTARLTAARDLLLDRSGAIVMLCGDAAGIETARREVSMLLATLPETTREKVDYAPLMLDLTREAMVVNSTIQMNMIVGTNEQFTGKDVVYASLMDDMYCLPQLRNALGAYGAYASLGNTSEILYTYRDPNLESTYTAFEALPEFLRTVELTQEMVDSYIVGSYTKLSRPVGALSGASRALNDCLIGISESDRVRWMQEAKATTVEDLHAQADRIQKLVNTGIRSTSAAASVIEAHKDLFDSVISLNPSDD